MTFTPVLIPNTEVHSIHSEIIGDDFELWIAKPQAGFVPLPPEPPTVLYVLDANLCFGTAVEMTRLMHKLYGELPPLLVVGIAYPTEDGFQQATLRNRDFTPSEDPGFAAMAASLPESMQSFQVEPAMGGANNFLCFLKQEVQPYLSSRFNITPEGSTIFGSSLGGLFVTYAIFTEPTTFDNFIIVSPALWWDNEMMFNLESSQAQAGVNIQANVFIAVGELEESPDIPMLAQFKMVTNVQKMADRLSQREDPSLRVNLDVIQGETHTSVIPAALTRALRSVLKMK